MYDYTFEDFKKSYSRDKEIFGEEAKYLYEELFSTINGKRISLEGIDEEIEAIEEAMCEAQAEDVMSALANKETGGTMAGNGLSTIEAVSDAAARQLPAAAARTLTAGVSTGAGQVAAGKVLDNVSNYLKDTKGAVNAATMKGLDGISHFMADPKVGIANTGRGILGFFKSLPMKIKAFFGGMKGMGFTEILKKGWGWIANPANAPILLGCAGGVLLLSILIKAAKRRRQQKLLAQMQDTQASMKTAQKNVKDGQIKESEMTKLEKIYSDIMFECDNNENKLLYRAVFGDVVKDVKPDYFVY